MRLIPLERFGDGRDAAIHDRCDAVDGLANQRGDGGIGGNRVGEHVAHGMARPRWTEIDHVDRRAVVVRLHDRHAGDRCVHERMRVAADDEIDRFVDGLGDTDDLAATRRGAGPIAERAVVVEHDHVVRAARAQPAGETVDDRPRRKEDQTGDVPRGSRSCGEHRGQADHTHLEPLPHDQRVVADPRHVPAVREPHICAEERIVGVAHPRTHGILSPVELVIPQRGSDVTQLVEQPDDGPAEGEIRRKRALELIARIDEERDAFGSHALGACATNRGREIGGAASTHSTTVRARLESPVKVVRADDAKPCGGTRRTLNVA